MSVLAPHMIVGHLAPDLDCITAIWILIRFGGADQADIQFVPSGSTYNNAAADADPRIIHVDTGGGRFDHHQHHDDTLCAAELVRRAVAPRDVVLQRLVAHVIRSDHAQVRRGEQALFFNINDLIGGFNAMFPNRPQHVTQAMLPNMDAWYEHEGRQLRLEQAFTRRIEFQTRWGRGIAMESEDGGSSKLAYREGAVLYAYRDGRGFSGIAAKSQSVVNLAPVYTTLQRIDPGADWYLHPNKRLLLCGTAKSPVQHLSDLSIDELVDVLRK